MLKTDRNSEQVTFYIEGSAHKDDDRANVGRIRSTFRICGLVLSNPRVNELYHLTGDSYKLDALLRECNDLAQVGTAYITRSAPNKHNGRRAVYVAIVVDKEYTSSHALRTIKARCAEAFDTIAQTMTVWDD
jgi:hypothetical protein